MATLTGQNIKDTYKTLLKTESTVGFNGSTPTVIEDGDGNNSSLSLSETRANISGNLSLNLSSTSTPRANLHIVGTGVQNLLVQNPNGYNKFYVGDFLGAYNVKLGDIDTASSGNNTYFYVEDSEGRVVSNSTYFGISQTVPTCSLHVGSNSGSALFSLGPGSEAFKITSSSNNTLFVVDNINDKIIVNGDIEMTGKGSLRQSTQRIKLEEYFSQLPSLHATLHAPLTNADASHSDNDAIITARAKANVNFEYLDVAGTSSVSWDTTIGGVKLQTGSSDDDEILLQAHQESSQTLWDQNSFLTQKELEWETSIYVNDKDNFAFWGGLKKSGSDDYTDSDQAYFLYTSDDGPVTTALTTNANLHFIYSVGGTHYVTDLGIAVADTTSYRLRIEIDSNRQVSAFVNEVQYGLVTSATTGGATQSLATTKSNALTNAVPLFSFIGAKTLSAAARYISVAYIKLSRIIG
jgi:hypothetical protein